MEAGVCLPAASGCEGALAGDVVGVRHRPCYRIQPAYASIGWRLGTQEPECVGMERLLTQTGRGATFKDAAGVEDLDPVAHRECNPQIMCDEDQAHATRLLQVAQSGENRPLCGHIERRGRLVSDQQLRIARESCGDAHPLPHSAGELERIGINHIAVTDANLVETADRLGASRGPAESVSRSRS